jgi:hypothetical protein
MRRDKVKQSGEMFELADAELDAVAGGAANGNALAAGGLVNVALGAANVEVLEGADINVLNGFSIKDVASHNNISVGAVIQALGSGAGVLTGQTQ